MKRTLGTLLAALALSALAGCDLEDLEEVYINVSAPAALLGPSLGYGDGYYGGDGYYDDGFYDEVYYEEEYYREEFYTESWVDEFYW